MPDVTGLFDSFLEAAVSLAVLFVIVAWVSSKIVELGQLTFNVHGKMLRDELERCFGEESGPNKGRFTRYFYWHPMIVPLTQPSGLVSFWRKIRGGFEQIGWIGSGNPETHFPPGRLPGHIAPESFAAVVMNPFPWPTTEVALRRLLIANLLPATPVEAVTDQVITDLILQGQTYQPGETWAALIDRAGLRASLPLNPAFLNSRVDIHGGPRLGDPAERYVEMCRANELIPHPLETRIVTLLRDADSDLDDFRVGLRRWYAEAMARVTGRFKRTALVWVFFVALVICTLFNLNAINLFNALMKSPELRAAGVAASEAVGTKPADIEALGQKVEFSDVYGRCVTPAQPPAARPMPTDECRLDLLNSLWRDSGKSNPVEGLFAGVEPTGDVTPPALPTPAPQDATTPAPAKKSPQLVQVERVRALCEEDEDLCGSALSTKLTACLEPGRGFPSDQCDAAWRAIWTGSGFFWHPEAAQKLALSLTDKRSDESAGLLVTLDGVQLKARRDTEAIKKFLGQLSNLGPVWNDKQFQGLGALWILFGILLSALLAALGAPFWYDVLGKLSRRGTSGARGEKT